MFVEGHDELGEDLVVDDTFGQFLVHVGQTAEGECGTLGDGRNIVEEEGSEKTHDAG